MVTHPVPLTGEVQPGLLLMFLQAAEVLEKQFAAELQQLKAAAEEEHRKVRLLSGP